MNRCLRTFCVACLMALSFVRPALSAPPLPDEVVIDGVEFVRVPAGYFWYAVETEYGNLRPFGSAAFRDVKIWLDEFYIGKYEARAKDFVRFMNSKAARSDFIGDDLLREPEMDGCAITFVPGAGYQERFPGKDFPATAVTWDLARDFARWMGFRLPTEAEWEKAARGTDKRIWPWGDEYPDDTFANYGYVSICVPAPVHSYPKGRSPYGAYNMVGNVAEWTANWFNMAFDQSLSNGMRNPPIPKGPALNDNSTFPARVVKGGRWSSIAGFMAIAMRDRWEGIGFNVSSGVRFAVDAEVVRARLQQGQAIIAKPLKDVSE